LLTKVPALSSSSCHPENRCPATSAAAATYTVPTTALRSKRTERIFPFVVAISDSIDIARMVVEAAKKKP
jgi:hypothetical protein